MNEKQHEPGAAPGFDRHMLEALICPKTGDNRVLYSLRHTYATLALVNDGMDIQALAQEMGISIAMIERHYSHSAPRMKKDMFTGKRYELSAEAYAAQKAEGGAGVGDEEE